MADDALVILKELDPGNTDPGRFTRFRHEYTLLQSLDIEGVAKPADLIAEDDCLTMVLDDFAGASLEAILDSDMRMALPMCLRIACALARVLARVHEAGIIHRDIRPRNILASPDGERVLLVDLSDATSQDDVSLPDDFVAHQNDWAYLSPEQTGRMNRTVDYRADFYSFGITLYRMLTGQLPFVADDPLEWAHCHIARTAPAPHSLARAVPSVVSNIVMKLLAKLPEDRYQSGAGLCRDLDDCLARWQAKGRILAFPLGREDFSNRFQIPNKLYGREAELASLMSAFEQMAARGQRTLVTVTGYAGVGKSSLVEALRAPTAAQRGYFIAGKFEQYLRDTPYTMLTQAFQELMRHLLSESEPVLVEWQRRLQEALGANGQVIVEVLPQLELILGKQPPVVELPPLEAQNRFRHVFRQFVNVFSRQDHPLVLFLDDVHWIDAASLQLLEHLLTNADSGHLLVIVACRDNELGASHPLLSSLDAIRRSGALVHDIELLPLSFAQLNRLVANMLQMTMASCRPLTRLVFERTGGNPFFFVQFLDSLHREGLLQWHAQRRTWLWDLEQIKAMDLADNVADLMAGKLRRLPAGVQHTLQLAACMGNKFDQHRLTLVSESAAKDIAQHLATAVREGLVVQTGDSGKFLHDRIQQAAYSLIAPERLNEVHLRIGRALYADLSEAELDAQLFDVVNQFNLSAGLLVDPQERQQVAALNLRAGRKAKASAAYVSACVYLAAGMALLDESDWERRYELMFKLWRERTQCELLSGRLEVAAPLIDVLRQRGASNVDKAAAYNLQILLHSFRSEMLPALESGLTCLRLFSIDIPAQLSEEQVQAEYETVWRNLGTRSIENLIDLPRMTDPDVQAIMNVCSDIMVLAITRDAKLARVILCRMVNLSLQHGVSGASAHAFATFATTLVGKDGRSNEFGYRFAQLAADLVEKHDFLAYKARVYLLMSVVCTWTQPLSVSLDYNQRAFNVAIEVGDLVFACFGSSTRIGHLLQRGDPLDDVWRESEQALAFVRKNGYRDVADLIVNRQRLVLAMQGRTAGLASFGDEHFDEAQFEAQQHVPGRMGLLPYFYWCLKLQAHFCAGNYEAALAAAARAKEFRWASSHTTAPNLEYYYYTALAIAAVYHTGADDAQRAWRAQLTAHEALLREWALSYPPTFGDKHALVAAEIARLDGHDLDAMHLYEQAIQAAHQGGFVQNEAVAHELAAGYCLARGFATYGNTHLAQARNCYARWGADGKVRQLDQRYPQLRAHTGRAPAMPGGGQSQLDLLSVSKAAQALSSRIVLDELIDTLLRIAIENAGAQTGCLLLVNKDGLTLAADANAEQQTVVVRLRDEQALPQAQLPTAILNYVRRSRDYVLLEDAAGPHAYAADPYFAQRHPKSVLCLPISRQSTLIGLLYLENDLASNVFTASRIKVLEMLASQAAISLENAQLFAALQQENIERKRAEETVRERNTRIQRLVESNIIGVFFWDMSGSITDANDAFLQMVGYSRQDLLSDKVHWGHMTPPEYGAVDAKAKKELEQRGSASPYEKEFIRKNGSRVPVLIGPALFEKSRNTGVAFVLDLSEHKRAEAEREARRAAEAANRAKSTFLANMSHELRTPLNGILGYAQILLRDKALSEQQREGVNVIWQSGEHLLMLINDILDLAKIETGKMELFLDDIELASFLHTIVQMVSVKAVQKGLNLICNIAPDVPRGIRADEKRLRQVLLNLLSNAVKFTDHGQVTLRVRYTPAARLQFEVHDTGVGIDANQLNVIFQPFEQAGDALHRLGGTGLGLTISRQYVRLMGGDIHVESRPGQGSTFWFALALPKVEAATAVPLSGIVTGYGGPRKTILVVDDIAENRAVAAGMLTSFGFEVVEAANGREALELAQRLNPHLILIDTAMPEMDGLEAVRRLRRLAAFKDVPVVAASASVSASDSEKCLEAGMNAFLTKPIDMDELLNQVVTLLQLDGIYESAARSSSRPDAAEAIVMPPVEELEVLYRLALQGNMQEILERTDYVSKLDQRYGPFASQLRSLAKGYQSKAILSLVEQCLHSDSLPGGQI